MIFYPAIDLKAGQCVRLVRGDMATATVFNDDPAAQARAFAAAGCRWLHVVDLDGAFAGRPVNAAAVASVRAAVDIPMQLGGGIRDLAAIEAWLAAGVDRVVLGTVAVREPALVDDACRRFPGRIAVGIDARDGAVAIEGWAEATGIPAVDLARRFEHAGVAAIVYTDIARDGAMAGPNLEATLALADAVRVPVILSGGVSSMDDLALVAERGAGRLDGVISGRALYDGRIDARAAVRLLDGPATVAGTG
jgi:phosphoribosylformimino-5-aminoimidazole carboxamide ribotide isomerase